MIGELGKASFSFPRNKNIFAVAITTKDGILYKYHRVIGWSHWFGRTREKLSLQHGYKGYFRAGVSRTRCALGYCWSCNSLLEVS